MEGFEFEIAEEWSSSMSPAKQGWLELPEVSSYKYEGRGEQNSFRVNEVEPSAMGRGSGWTAFQDLTLCCSWIEATGNPVIGTCQKRDDFWIRVRKTYQDESKNLRSDRAIRNRWALIAAACQKFAGCYIAAEKTIASGMNEDDVMNCALQTYAVDAENEFNQAQEANKGKELASSARPGKGASGKEPSSGQNISFAFEFIDCWKKLSTCAKFMNCVKGSSQKHSTSFVADSGLPSTPSSNGKAMQSSAEFPNDVHPPAAFSNDVRPIGCKKAKREQVHLKFQEKILDFMEDTKSHGGEVCQYMKILTATLLVHTHDLPLTNSQQSFFANAERMMFDSIVHSPRGSVVPPSSPSVPPMYNGPPPVPSTPSSSYQGVGLGIPGGAANSPIALDGDLDGDLDSDLYWTENQSRYTVANPPYDAAAFNEERIDCNLGL